MRLTVSIKGPLGPVATADWTTPWGTVEFDPKSGTTKTIRHTQPVPIRLKKKYRRA
jgi:hypothetical protein